jgi:hypothetical protein
MHQDGSVANRALAIPFRPRRSIVGETSADRVLRISRARRLRANVS